MMTSVRRRLLMAGVAVLCAVNSATAQQITIGTPSVNIGDSFFESIGGGFNLGAAQGSSRNLSATAGSLTVTNGVPGFFAATTQRPFVTGLIPVVGDYGGLAPVFGPAALIQPPTNRTSVVRERINRLKTGERALPPRSVNGGVPINHRRRWRQRSVSFASCGRAVQLGRSRRLKRRGDSPPASERRK